jgi:hypothetical protein
MLPWRRRRRLNLENGFCDGAMQFFLQTLASVLLRVSQGILIDAHSTVKCNTRIFDVEEDLVRGFVSEDLSGAGVEFILDPLDIGM